jgi:hypothetical protein
VVGTDVCAGAIDAKVARMKMNATADRMVGL